MMNRDRRYSGLLAAGLAFTLLSACSALLVGEGTSTSPAIGSKQRSTTQVADDHDSAAALRSAYATDSMLRSENLSLTVAGGVATLSGVVSSFELRDRAVDMAGEIAGISRVNNQLRVDTRQ